MEIPHDDFCSPLSPPGSSLSDGTITRAVSWRGAIRRESTIFLVVETDGGMTHVIRCAGSGGDGKTVIIDWLSCRLAGLLQIPVPLPVLIDLRPVLLLAEFDPGVSALVTQHLESNSATSFIQEIPDPAHLQTLPPAARMADNIFLFDLLIGSLDWTWDYTNILRLKGCLFCHDFACSITMRSALNGRDTVLPQPIAIYRHHPFYRAGIPVERFRREVQALSDASFTGITDVMPAAWLQRLYPDLGLEETKAKVVRALQIIRKKAPRLDALVAAIDRSSFGPGHIRVSRMFGNTKAFLCRIVKSGFGCRRG